MQVQAPVSSALQGRRPNGRYGCDRTGPRRDCCHCRHERVQAGVGENWRQYSYLSGSSMDLEGVRIATPPNVTRAMIRRYQYHQPGALAERGGQALEDAVVSDIVETFPNVQIRAVRGAVRLPRFVEKGQRAHNDAYYLKAGVLVILFIYMCPFGKKMFYKIGRSFHFACATGHVTGGTRGKSHARRFLTS